MRLLKLLIEGLAVRTFSFGVINESRLGNWLAAASLFDSAKNIKEIFVGSLKIY